jgi:hypothetical protein
METVYVKTKFTIILALLIFLQYWGFELRALHLLGKHYHLSHAPSLLL